MVSKPRPRWCPGRGPGGAPGVGPGSRPWSRRCRRVFAVAPVGPVQTIRFEFLVFISGLRFGSGSIPFAIVISRVICEC